MAVAIRNPGDQSRSLDWKGSFQCLVIRCSLFLSNIQNASVPRLRSNSTVLYAVSLLLIISIVGRQAHDVGSTTHMSLWEAMYAFLNWIADRFLTDALQSWPIRRSPFSSPESRRQVLSQATGPAFKRGKLAVISLCKRPMFFPFRFGRLTCPFQASRNPNSQRPRRLPHPRSPAP